MKRYAMANGYAHKGMTGMALREMGDVYDLISVKELRHHPDLGPCFIGAFVFGIGAFEVHFPAKHVRPCNDAELAEYAGVRCGATYRPSFNLEGRDAFHDSASLDTILLKATVPNG